MALFFVKGLSGGVPVWASHISADTLSSAMQIARDIAADTRGREEAAAAAAKFGLSIPPPLPANIGWSARRSNASMDQAINIRRAA